jgi:hypothetical protein
MILGFVGAEITSQLLDRSLKPLFDLPGGTRIVDSRRDSNPDGQIRQHIKQFLLDRKMHLFPLSSRRIS